MVTSLRAPAIVLSLLVCLLACACEEDRAQPEPGGLADAGLQDAAITADSGTLDADEPAEAGPVGVSVLGSGTHETASVDLTELAVAADGLSTPRDLAFNPDADRELWVVNRGDESISIIFHAGTPEQTTSRRHSWDSEHFLAQPSGLAFGRPGTLATIHETDQLTQGNLTPEDFMGPTFWTSDTAIFDAGDPSHLGMLHNSPLGMGIAWERDDVYWVFDGMHSAITRYDFHGGHELGGTDHSGGEVARFVSGAVTRAPGVPSHLDFDSSTALLYIADTGNDRILVLDTTTGTRGRSIDPNYDDDVQYMMGGAFISTLIDGANAGLIRPSGLALHDGMIFVTDNDTSMIVAFTMSGELVDWLDTNLPRGSLMGLTFDDEGRIYVCDAIGDRVLRVAPKTP